MRLFVAIDIPDAVKDHLAFLQRSLDGFPGSRWVAPKNIHLTLSFLGEQNSAQQVIEQLSKISFESFTLRLSELVFFPPYHSRLLWLTLEESKELAHLQAAVDNIFKPDSSFKPHLTLARMKKIRPKDLDVLVQAADKLEVKPLSFKVTSFKLYQSTLTAVGPIYEVLETFRAR